MLNGISFNFKQITLGDDKKAIWSLKTKKSAGWNDIPLCIKLKKKTINTGWV